ncbi:hypothetical protein HOLleu_15909 [Holothuria leucospilota]|uniref:arylamine N-acetyltransferase n=1 Tax=Holothuria leucospilota TaxID=206669 RepID=A0A9Q1HAI2_HOLLE|nr:hypothetical protein HOLleu_15909 [Holothuria leucospilota]
MTSRARESSYPLTKEEALKFLECNLGIPTSQICTDGKSMEFLNRVIKEMDRSLPFNNFTRLTEGPLSNFKPEDWKNKILSGQGGTCRCKNPFMKALLECLGYTTLQIPGNNPLRDGKNQTHISTLVCDISYPGSRHLVDTSTCWPLGEAIPIDFATESPEYSSYQIRRKFFKIDKDFLHLGIPLPSGGPEKQVMRDASGAKWEIRMIYWLNERADWKEFNESFIKTHEIQNLPFKKPYDTLLFYGFLNKKRVRIVCPDGQIHATFYSLEDSTKEYVIMTKAELLDFFQNHFPQYSVQKLEKACQVSNVI